MKCVLFSLILMMIALIGCEEVFINRGDLTEVNKNVGLISNQLDIVQDAMTKTAENGLLNAETVENINKSIEKYQPTLVKAADAIANAPTLIEGAIEANKISAPVNPYAGTIDLVLKLIASTGVLGTIGFAVRNNQNVNAKTKVEVKYKATNSANELLRMNHPEIAKEHYELVGTSRMAELANKGIS